MRQVIAEDRRAVIEQRSHILPAIRDGAADRVGHRAEKRHVPAIDDTLKKEIQDLAVRVRDAATKSRYPATFRRMLRQRVDRVERRNFRMVLDPAAIALPLRKDHSAGACDTEDRKSV